MLNLLYKPFRVSAGPVVAIISFANKSAVVLTGTYLIDLSIDA